jgi:hypothetical protein
MKSSIVYLGILATVFTSASYATANQQQQSVRLELTASQVQSTPVLNKPAIPAESVQTITQSVATMTTNIIKPVEQIIQENKLITDTPNEVYQPLTIDTSFDDRIQIDNQIIDNNQADEVYPLNFDYYNQGQILINSLEIKNKEALKS